MTPAARDDTAVLARGGLLNLVGTAAYGALGFVLVLVVTRGLGTHRAGAFFEAIALFAILGRAAILGADVGLVRFVARALALGRHGDVRSYLRVALVPVMIAGAVAGVVMFAFAGPLSRVFAQDPGDRAALATYARVFAPFVVITAVYGALEAATRGFGTMVPSVTVERIGRSVAQPLAVGTVVALGGGALGVGVAYALPYLAGAVVLTWWVRRLARGARRRAEGGPPHEAADREEGFWSFTAPRALSSIFQIALLWLDVLLVGALASSTEAGVYAAATRYLLMGTMAGQALSTAIQPQVSALLARGANRRAGDLFQIAAAWTMVVSWPIFLTVMVFARALLDVLGAGFSQADTALVVLGAAWVFASACGPIDVLLLMAGASRWNLANNAVAVASNVVLNLVLVPRWGITGAAVAWAVSIVITNAAPAVVVWYLLRIHPFGRASAAVAAASVGLLAAELAVRSVLGTSLVALVAGVAAGVGLYVVLLATRPTVLEPHALRAAFRRVASATR